MDDATLATKTGAPSTAAPLNDSPKVVRHNIPQIDLYQVTEDELNRLQDG